MAKRNLIDYWTTADGEDYFPAFNRAIGSYSNPQGMQIEVPEGKYGLSNNVLINGQVSIIGEGVALSHTTEIFPLPNFPNSADLITINGGYSRVKNIRMDMDLLGANCITFLGEGGDNYVTGCVILRVSENNWGIELRDPKGSNGIAGMKIKDNHFTDFVGGAIWGNGGGDSCLIEDNFFQLLRSKSSILKWDSVQGAACLNFSRNNGTSAEKFIEINSATEFKIMFNQFEALTKLTNHSKAMIEVNGPSIGSTISDNNLNCHGGSAGGKFETNAETGIYLNDVQNCLVSNNTISGAINLIETTELTKDITFLKGYGEGILKDSTNAIRTIQTNGRLQKHKELF